jgi:hypothetical protein
MGTGLTVSEWRNYGKHRLYVNDAAGMRVGWVDLATGTETIEQPALAELFRAAVAAHRCAPTPAELAAPSPPPDPAPTAPDPDPLPAELDLATNRAGQGVREIAEAEWAAQRERSRVGAWFNRLTDAKTDERAYRVGAAGEETVGKRLEKLTGRGWFVLHSVPVGDRGSDIDHVLIGHGGVYTINTKNHPDSRIWVGRNTIKVNGRNVPYLHKSRFEAERAERLLTEAVGFPVMVKPIIVLLTGTLIPNVTVKTQPDGVLVLDRMDIPGAFKKAPRRIGPEGIEAIYEAARRPDTWT